MNALTTSRPVSRRPAGAVGPLTGTGALLRFALRRDRVRLPVWVAALCLGALATAPSLREIYPDQAALRSGAEAQSSPAALATNGPAHYLADPSYGGLFSQQMVGFMAVMACLMTVLAVARHTRTEEESGRAELVRAAAVGRHAQLAAALGVVLVTNLLLGLLLALGLGGSRLEGFGWEGSVLFGAAIAATGLVFGAVAAVTVQITAHARAASGMGLAVLGLAYVLRAVGDVGGGTLSWLSPIGWAQRAYPYADDRWWPLLLSLVSAAGLAGAGFALSTRRDVGAGLRAARPGRPTGSAGLARPVGLALRLQRGLLIGFGAAVLLLGGVYGSILGDVDALLADVDEYEAVLRRLGDGSLVAAFAASVLTVLAIVTSIHAVLATTRARVEETAGRAEPLLATGLSRSRWLAGHLTIAAGGGALLLALGGLGMGVAGALSTGDGGLVLELAGAGAAHTPALWVTIGVAVALFGWLPRAMALAWVVPVYAFVVVYLGELLRFPAWLSDLSPFGHVPLLPAQEMEWTPILLLTALAATLFAFGVAGFRRRDVTTK